MFIEICLICAGLKGGSDLYKKITGKNRKEKNTDEPANPRPVKTSHNVPAKKELSQDTDKEAFAKEVERSFALCVGASGLAVVGALFWHPLSLLSALVTLYGSLPIFKAAKDAVLKEHRISRIAIIDTFAVFVAVLSGYYVGAALASTAYFGAQKLRLRTEKKSKQALANIFGEQPHSVWLLKDGVEIEVPFESLLAGEIVVVSSGEQIPADGLVMEGIASVDQHVLTGESQLVEKEVGDRVFAATILISGKLYIQVESAGQETVAAKIGNILKNTSDFTDSIESVGQEAADVSVVPALALGFGAFPFVGVGGTVALLFGDFLVNMRLTAPIGMLNYLQIASHDGVLIKDGRSLQLLPQIDTVVFDKTGTITQEQPHVCEVHIFDDDTDETTVLSLAAAAEQRQSHPIARAIIEAARDRSITVPDVDDTAYTVSYGITAEISRHTVRVGSDRFMEMQGIEVPVAFDAVKKKGHEQGCSFVYVAVGNRPAGAIELEPTIRPEAEEIIRRLKRRNMTFYIISGDNEKPTRTLSRKLGIDHYFAEVLPEDKAELIEALRKQGKKICFVGDGINDSIALRKADVSVSMRGASTVATDSAQIVLMDQSLRKLPDLFDLSYSFQDNLKDTFFAVSCPMIFGIGGVFFAGFRLPIMIGLFIVSVSSGAVTTMLPALKNRKKAPSEDSDKRDESSYISMPIKS